MIGGAVGAVMLLDWYGKRHMITMTLRIQEEQQKAKAETEKKTEE